MKIKIIFLFIIFYPLRTFSETPFDFENLLSLKETGASDFLEKHPEFDGRGVYVAILDTGVDMGVEGLKTTSTGEKKVVEARDFTEEGSVKIRPAYFEGKENDKILKNSETWVKGAEKLPIKPQNGKYWLGIFKESRLKNAALKDVNSNGRLDDEFPLVVFEAKEGITSEWVASVDTNGDHDISGEKIIHNFSSSLTSFRFSGQNQAQSVPADCAIEIDMPFETVHLHIPGGSHGTHVAGIAAGFRLNGKEGFNGIAPGAKILSLKIGDNTLSGGSTTTESMKRAVEFAVNFAHEKNAPVVINMSYGIGSEVEGKSDIDVFIGRIVQKNPEIVFVLSAGNEGPGISTMGTPAASLHAITAGALLTEKNSKVLLGGKTTGNVIFSFSSRGGELDKPDIIAPGIASSAVPPWETEDLMRGTSMAAPQISGAAALLISGYLREKAGSAFNSFMIKQALKLSANPLKNYSEIDQGAGIPDIAEAFSLLKKFARNPENQIILGYEVTTMVPTIPGGKGRAAYWRSGKYFPLPPQYQEFSIKPVFAESASGEKRNGFFKTFRLKSNSPWISPDRNETYMRGEKPAVVRVMYNASYLKSPGVFTGKVSGISDGFEEFRLLNTIVIPNISESSSNYSLDFKEKKLEPGKYERFFLSVPPGATSLLVNMKQTGKSYGSIYIYSYDNDGRKLLFKEPFINTAEGKNSFNGILSDEKLPKGVLEFVSYAPLLNPSVSAYDISFRFTGLSAHNVILQSSSGEYPSGKFKIINTFEEPFIGHALGETDIFERENEFKIRDDTLRYDFSVSPEGRQVIFEMSMSEKDYVRFTDIAVDIVDSSEKSLLQSGFIQKKCTIKFPVPKNVPAEGGKYVLRIKGGFAEKSEKEWKVKIKETYELRKKVQASVFQNGQMRFTLYPQVTSELEIKLSSYPPKPPSGAKIKGSLYFYSEPDEKIWLILPFMIK
jgi:subtilisin family serine protease